jgi:O-antigen chain-terminating methyltransferase
MDAGFYRAFEDRYRGSRALITQRLEVYLPFLAPLKALYQDCAVLDIGCGRGEWLELLIREGYTPTGVDLDDGMLEGCHALQLPARKDDALNALRQLPDESLVVVSGFHIAEHVPFPILQDLVAEALRVLRPAGLLILETPNAESVVVGTNSFYLDPTHERPLPNLLMSFLTEHSGFLRSKVVRLQEVPEIRDEGAKVGIWEVLSGTSPDYAVVAQKQAQPELLEAFDAVFETSFGVSLDQLAIRYDKALEGRLCKIENQIVSDVRELMNRLQVEQTEKLQLIDERRSAQVSALQQECDVLQQRLQETLDRAEKLEAEMNLSLGNAHNWYMRALAHEQQLEAVRRSTSWRLTVPLRIVSRALYWPARGGRSSLADALRRAAPHARLWLARRPAIQRQVLAILHRTPRLEAKLRGLLQAHAVVDDANASDLQHGVIDHAPLTPRGRAIESALRQPMMKGQK